MQMRRGWVGLCGVFVASLLGACEEDARPGDEQEPGDGATAAIVEEDTIPTMIALACPAVTSTRARNYRVEMPAGSSRVVYLDGAGRNHSLLVWADRENARTLTVTEMEGATNGVEIEIEPAPGSPALPWGVLTLDAGGCRPDPENPPYIVKRHEDGVLTVPDGSFDPKAQTAFAVVRGNSGYMLATPTRDDP